MKKLIRSSEMDQITFHKATQADIKTLVDYRILFSLEMSGERPEEIVALLKNQLTACFLKGITDNSCISIIAKCRNEVAGIGSVHLRQMPGNFKNPSGMWGYIMNMYTVPEFRKKGICNTILNLLVEEGMKQDVTAFELHATRDGEPVYIKNGFVMHHEPTLRKYCIAPHTK